MDVFTCLDAVRKVGVQDGDIIDVASDTLSLMIYCRKRKIKYDMNVIIDDLKKAVGKDGTVMIRAFNWDFCKGETFDIRSTPSRVGAMGNAAMKRDDFNRTRHPLYSWMVCGKYSEELCAIEGKNAFGIGSLFDFLYKKNAKLLRLGKTEQRGFTHIHHAEALVGVPYRFEKEFTGNYINEYGDVLHRSYSMYVRYLDVDSCTDLFPDVDCELEKKSIIKNYIYDGLFFQTTNIKDATDFVVDDLKNNYGKRVCVINGEKGFENYVNYKFKIK